MSDAAKPIEIEILKKNRKYFAISKNGYKCKLLIDDASADLPLGVQTLMLEDISVVTKFGKDVIFKVAGGVEQVTSAGICTLQTPDIQYNQHLHKQCKKLGGKWDSDAETWVFSDIVQDKVEELDEIWNSALVAIEVEAKHGVGETREPVYFLGFKVATAWDRDGGAKLAEGIAVVKGRVTSGGSRANWTTRVTKGTVIRLRVPILVFEKYYTYENTRWLLRTGTCTHSVEVDLRQEYGEDFYVLCEGCGRERLSKLNEGWSVICDKIKDEVGITFDASLNESNTHVRFSDGNKNVWVAYGDLRTLRMDLAFKFREEGVNFNETFWQRVEKSRSDPTTRDNVE